MVNKRLVDYIAKVTDKGLTLEQAEEKLLKAGNKKREVKDAIYAFKKKKYHIIGSVVLGLILVVGGTSLIIDLLKDPEVKPSSFDLLKMTIQEGNISACDQFNPVKQDVCRRTILGDLGGDNPPNLPVEQSIIDNAVEQMDPSLCGEIVDEVQKFRCLVLSGGAAPPSVERYVFDVETNQTIPTEYQAIEDITEAAMLLKDPSLCEAITNSVKKYRCEVKAS